MSQSYSDLGKGSNIVGSPIETYKNHIKSGKLFNEHMLNLFFAEKVGTAFGGSNDLSLQKYFASLDASDDSFTIGFNFDNRGGKVFEKLNWVFTFGAKFKSDNKFSTVFDGSDFQSANLGAIIKVSLIGDGVINYNKIVTNGVVTKDRQNSVKEYRKIIFDKIDEKVKNYNTKEFKKLEQEYNKLKPHYSDIKTLTSSLEKKKNEIYKEIAEEEIQFLKNEKMYRYIFDYWFSFEAFIPLGTNEYQVAPIVNGEASKESLYALNLALSGNLFLEWSKGISLFINAKYGIAGTNNIILDNLKLTSFQSAVLNTDNTITISPAIEAYDTVYNSFINHSLRIEPAIFFFKNTIGISPAVEFNLNSPYTATNWKVGLPISLKDKDGKPKVNFEIQWKRVSTLSEKSNLIGVSTSFLFGDLIN